MQPIQSLDCRLMLFAELIDRPEINGQELQVTGTAGEDVIRVEYNPAGDRLVATLNEQTLDFDPLVVKRINVLAGDGNDSAFVASGFSRSASLSGGAGNDSLTSTNGPDTLRGDAGNDVLDGGSLNDQLFGGEGDDQLFGRGADDFLTPGTGTDIVDGGSGRNEAIYEERTDDLSLSLDGVANDGAPGENDILLRIHALFGGAGDDLIVGNGQGNELIGFSGSDTILGQGGDDTLIDDLVTLDPDDDQLDGGSGDDRLQASHGNDTLIGGAGDDTLSGGEDNDSMLGGTGEDSMTVQFGAGSGDTALGESGDDTFNIFDGSSIVDGGSGSDFFSDRVEGLIEGQRTLLGRGGNDTFTTSFPGDPFDASGGSGIDTLLMTDPRGVRVTLDNLANDGRVDEPSHAANIRSDFENFHGNDGNDFFDASAVPRGVTIFGRDGHDTLIGSNFADILEGNQKEDSLVGNGGEDILRGGDQNDTLTGGPGLDSFNGGFGNDVMNAAEGEADTVNGAQGLGDLAAIDELLDTLVRVESTT